MLIYWAGSSQTASPRERADTRPWIDLTNEAQHVETHAVSVERAKEESAADRPDPVWLLFIFAQKSGLRAVLVRRSSYAHEETRNV